MKEQVEAVIVKYIVDKLISSNEFSTPLVSNSFILNKKLNIFEDENSWLYGASTTISDIKTNIFCLSQELNKDYLIIIFQATNLPTYALYYDNESNYYKLFCKTNISSWMNSNTLLQATFLAGMEQINNSHLYYELADINDFNIDDLKSLIEFSNKE